MRLINRILPVVFLTFFAAHANAMLITHSATDGIIDTPAFGALGTAVDMQFISAGADYTYGNTEGIFDDGGGVGAICGINGSNICDLLTDVDARVVGPGSTAQGYASFISVEGGFAAAGSLLLEIFDKTETLLDSITLGPPDGPNGRYTATLDRGGVYDIAYYRISGGDTYGVNTVTLNVVPVPGVLALMGIALLSLAGIRRRA